MPPRNLDTVRDRRIEKNQFARLIGDHLRQQRSAKGISQEQLALNCGYYRTYVNKIETGNYSPSLHTIWRLADGLGMNLSEFFRGFDSVPDNGPYTGR
jgi:transcriptional regulator with XRE-family HTH domain